jgi:hypothetical protein
MEGACIMIGMAMGDDDRADHDARDTHLLHMKTRERRRVYHDPSTMHPENVPASGSFRIESMGLTIQNLYTQPSTVTPKSGGVNVVVLSSSNCSMIMDAFWTLA